MVQIVRASLIAATIKKVGGGHRIVGGDQRTAAEWSLMIIGFTATILVTAYLALLARRELARADVR